MEITGKIIAVLPPRSGVSARTGNPWMSQEYVIETIENYPRKCCFNIWGEDKIKTFNIQVGETMTVSVDIDAREYQGRWYNDIRCWQINRNPQVAGAVSAAGAASATAAQPGAQTATASPFPPAQEPAGESNDDLPF